MTLDVNKYDKVIVAVRVLEDAEREWRKALIDERQEAARELLNSLTTEHQRTWAKIALRQMYDLGVTLAEHHAQYSNFDPVPKEA